MFLWLKQCKLKQWPLSFSSLIQRIEKNSKNKVLGQNGIVKKIYWLKVYNLKIMRTKVFFLLIFEKTTYFYIFFSLSSLFFQSCPCSTYLNPLSFNLTSKRDNHLKKSLRTKMKKYKFFEQWVHNEMWDG